MKTRKPRAKKAVKPAARTARRVIRATAKSPRAKGKARKRKVSKSKTARKPGPRLSARPKAAVKVRSTRRPLVRKRKATPTGLVEGEHVELPVAAGPEPESGTALSAEPEAPELADAKVASAPSVEPKAPVKPSARRTRKKPAPAKHRLEIPPILLEGDEPQSPSTGPGEKYALGPRPAAGPPGREPRELPEAYGTGRLLLVARDPHWLYVHWDFTPLQQRQYNALSADRHLVVRVYPGTITAHPSSEIHVHPESRSWFIHVERAATRYSAVLGYYPPNRQWVTVATSAPVVTPPDTVSQDKTLRFATIPTKVPLRDLPGPAKQTRRAEPPPLRAQQERALAAVFKRYRILQQPASSVEIPELVRGPVEGEAAPALPVVPTPAGAPIESISSPPGGAAQVPKGFWLNLNAELVLYGATEPDALVTISGQPIALRPAGTFSVRFSLPDGAYEINVSARSAEGDSRQAVLKFSRRTEHQGEVGTAPQDPSLNPPTAESP
jgi:uncharacterized protein